MRTCDVICYREVHYFRNSSPIFRVASLQLGTVVAFDTSAGAWLSRCVVAHESTVFKRPMLVVSVDTLSVVCLTFEDVACALVVDPLIIRIADFKRIRLSGHELALSGICI